jgi:hypothetical protein
MNASEIKIIESDVKNSHYYPDDYSPCNTCINRNGKEYAQICLTCAYFYKSNYSPRLPDKVISQILGSESRRG